MSSPRAPKTPEPQENPLQSTSRPASGREFGLHAEDEAALGSDRVTRLRTIRLLVMLSQHLRQHLDALYAADGITTQQAALLSIVQELGAPSFREAAEVLRSTHQNVKQLFLPLEKKGLLRVEDDPNDGRVKRLRTTAKNTRYWAKRDPVDHARVLTLFADLNEGEASQLFALLSKIYERATRSG